MQLNCKVIKKWQPSPPISISNPPFSRLAPLSSKLAPPPPPPEATQLLESPTPHAPLIKGEISNYETSAFELLQLFFEAFRIPNLFGKVYLITF